MIQLKHIYVVTVFLLLSSISKTIGQTNTPLSLEDCLITAFEKNSSFLTIDNLSEIREQNHRILRTGLLPQLSASSSLNQFTQNSTVIFTNDILPPSKIDGARTDGLAASVNASINIMDFGQTISDLRAQRFLNEAAYLREAEEKQSIILLISKTYYDCLISQEISIRVEEQLLTSQEILNIANQKVELGEIDSTEFYQALINYNKDLNTKHLVNSIEEETFNNLKILLGINVMSDVELKNRIILFEGVEPQQSDSFDPQSRLLVSALEKDLKGTQIKSKSSLWELYPNISLFAGFGYSNQTFQNGIVQQNEAIGSSYGISINYDFGSIKNTIHRNKVLKKESDILRIKIEEETSKEQSDYNALTSKVEQHRQALASNQTILDMSTLTLEHAMLKYKLGSITLTDLRLAQNQLLTAQIELNKSVAEYNLSQLELYSKSNSLKEWALSR